MSTTLEAISEPRRLILAWQSSNLEGDNRFRYAVGEVEPGVCATFRYFDRGAEFEGHNQGRRYDELDGLGYRGYPAFDRSTTLHTWGVLDALMRRLPPRSRSDYADYLSRFLLPADRPLSDVALLGRTEATLPSDGFSLVDPLDPALRRCDLLLEVAGFRHYADKVEVAVGDAAALVADPTNRHDANAVDVFVGGEKIGNINRLQAATFGVWLAEAEVEARVERLNGTATRPRAYIFVRVAPRADRLAA